MADSALSLALTPHGHVVLVPSAGAPTVPRELVQRLERAFTRSAAHGLLDLGLREVGTALPPGLGFWRDFGARYVTALCTSAEASATGTTLDTIAAPSQDELDGLVAAAPPMGGGEYLTPAVLESLWEQVDDACRAERAESKQSLQDYLKARNPAWHLVGRVHFNLAENRGDEQTPFAFLATYTTRLSSQGRAQHLPLAEALREYAGARNKAQLLSLLQPVRRGAAQCGWLREMVETGEIYHPLRWTPAEALQFLTDVPALEAAGIVVRTPSGWASGRPPDRGSGPRSAGASPRSSARRRCSISASSSPSAMNASRPPRFARCWPAQMACGSCAAAGSRWTAGSYRSCSSDSSG